MRIGICDDDKQSRLMVRKWLKTHPETLGRSFCEFCSGDALLEYLRANTLDIIFLDCRMEGKDGIETARLIRKQDHRVVIILLTDFTGYARFGYGADVLDYILKQDFDARIDKVFEKALNRIKDSRIKTYLVKTSAGMVQLDISEILYIESDGRKKKLFMRSGQMFEFYSRFDDIESSLKKHGFIRPHHSFLINSKYIKRFTTNYIWLSGLEKPFFVSRGRYRQAYDDFTVLATEVCL